MADAPTTTVPRVAPDDPLSGGPRISPRRSLPGGRAVVGAFLVVVAVVGTFGAFLQATADPSTRYLVAAAPVDVGDLLGEDDVQRLFEAVAVDLPEEQAARAVRATDRRELVGTVVVAPIATADLLLASAVQPVGSAQDGVQLSFSLPADRAVGGEVAAGERVDVIATFAGGAGSEAVTRVVARQVTIVGRPAVGDGLGGGQVVLTVRVPDLATAQALQHAVDVADVAVLRGADPSAADPAPESGPAAERPDPSGVDDVTGLDDGEGGS